MPFTNVESPSVWQDKKSLFIPPEIPAFRYQTESKMRRVARRIFSCICFPVALYQLVHSLIGRVVLVSRLYPSFVRDKEINQFTKHPCFNYENVTIEVDENLLHAMIIEPKFPLEKRRWTLYSGGNGEPMESTLLRQTFYDTLLRTRSSGIVYNYPGVGKSTGSLDRRTLAKTYKAMLKFLEEKKKPEEIVGIGWSLGGAVQGEALRNYSLNPNISYVFVKSQTFSQLSLVAPNFIKKLMSHLGCHYLIDKISRLAGKLIKLIGWNMESVESSIQLQAPEIIIQSSAGWDGIIPHEASLLQSIEKLKFNGKKYFIEVDASHSGSVIGRNGVSQLIHGILAGKSFAGQ